LPSLAARSSRDRPEHGLTGLPGADWWVAGAVPARAEDADVELDEVERFYDERDLWNDLA
jgi:hypothetical protein